MFEKIKEGLQEKTAQIFHKGPEQLESDREKLTDVEALIQDVRDGIKDIIAKQGASPAIAKSMERLDECEMWLHMHLFGRR